MAFRKYTVIYEPADDGGYYAHIPALGITTEGDTLDEAKEMARDAIENTLACLDHSSSGLDRGRISAKALNKNLAQSFL